MEEEVLELIKVHMPVVVVVHLLEKLRREPLFDWHLEFDEHLLQLVQTQKVVFVDIQLVEQLF